jgi:hypothetical protein
MAETELLLDCTVTVEKEKGIQVMDAKKKSWVLIVIGAVLCMVFIIKLAAGIYIYELIWLVPIIIVGGILISVGNKKIRSLDNDEVAKKLNEAYKKESEPDQKK